MAEVMGCCLVHLIQWNGERRCPACELEAEIEELRTRLKESGLDDEEAAIWRAVAHMYDIYYDTHRSEIELDSAVADLMAAWNRMLR